jgi:hypothetical protein
MGVFEYYHHDITRVLKQKWVEKPYQAWCLIAPQGASLRTAVVTRLRVALRGGAAGLWQLALPQAPKTHPRLFCIAEVTHNCLALVGGQAACG